MNKIIVHLKTLEEKCDRNRLLTTLKKLNILQAKINIGSSNVVDKSKKPKSMLFEIIEFFKSMLSAMFLAMVIRSLLLQPFNIPSESMLPNLLVGDYLFVNKYAYGYSNYSFPFAPYLFNGRILSSEPKRGDVAVFRVTEDDNKDYIKRVVGLPGDKIQFLNGSVIVNGKPSFVMIKGAYGDDTIDPETIGARIVNEKIDDKSFDTLDVFEAPYDNTIEFTVPKDHFFFAGDNRDNSQDSRFMNGPVGFVHRDKLIGRAEFIFFSIRDGSFIEFWKWPTNIRFDRFFAAIQ